MDGVGRQQGVIHIAARRPAGFRGSFSVVGCHHTRTSSAAGVVVRA